MKKSKLKEGMYEGIFDKIKGAFRRGLTDEESNDIYQLTSIIDDAHGDKMGTEYLDDYWASKVIDGMRNLSANGVLKKIDPESETAKKLKRLMIMAKNPHTDPKQKSRDTMKTFDKKFNTDYIGVLPGTDPFSKNESTNESMIPTIRDINKMSKDQLIKIQGILFGRSDQKKILNAIRKRLEQIDESVNEGKDKWVVYDIETKKRLPNPGKSWATMKAAQAFADKQKNADVASDIWYFDKIKESLNEGPDYSEASFQMDKIFGDDQESIEIFQDIEDNGTVEDMIDYIENYGDEDQLQRYGIRSAAHVKKFAQHIMRKR